MLRRAADNLFDLAARLSAVALVSLAAGWGGISGAIWALDGLHINFGQTERAAQCWEVSDAL